MTDEQRRELMRLVYGMPDTQDALAEYAFELAPTVPYAAHFAYATRLGARDEGAMYLRKMLNGDPPPDWWKPR